MANDPYVNAYNHLFKEVHANAFFGALANRYGITPVTEKEAKDLLAIAGNLRDMPTPSQEQNNSSRFQKAASALGTIQNTAAVPADSIKQAAAQLSQDPNIYASVLALKLKEAELMNSPA